MHFDIFTLFPGMFADVFNDSIIMRAQEARYISIATHDIIFRSVEAVLGSDGEASGNSAIVLLSPQGRPFTQTVASELAQHERLALICGRYEGVDERVRDSLATDEISIGDYVLSGGEIAAMVVVDAVTRLLPGVLGDPAATAQDSHATGLLEHPHYTRPAEFRGHGVPEVLLSGHHAEIARWRRRESLRRTLLRRPDLLNRANLSREDEAFLHQLGWSRPEPPAAGAH